MTNVIDVISRPSGMKDMDTADIRELEDAIAPVWEIAQGLGLDPYPVHYELVPASIMYEFGSYGLPGRFSHWSHGKMYNRMKTQYDYGLSKIYELVINTNPSYAFLMEGNSVCRTSWLWRTCWGIAISSRITLTLGPRTGGWSRRRR